MRDSSPRSRQGGVKVSKDMPNKLKPRVLLVVNPNASRAAAALPGLSSWFTENCHARIVVAKSKKERMRELETHGKAVDLIVIGGGDGTISTAVSQLLSSNDHSP
jgi:diacylglycerol kinase family enzyme